MYVRERQRGRESESVSTSKSPPENAHTRIINQLHGNSFVSHLLVLIASQCVLLCMCMY